MADITPSSACSHTRSGHIRVHARLRSNANQAPYGLHVWGNVVATGTTWEAPLPPVGEDWYGPYFDVALADTGNQNSTEGSPAGLALGMLLHFHEDKAACLEISSVTEVPLGGSEVWFGHTVGWTAEAPNPKDVPSGDLLKGGARAHWLTEGFIAWRAASAAPSGSMFWLHSSSTASLEDSGSLGVAQSDTDEGLHELKLVPGGLTPALEVAHPYLAGCALLEVPHDVHVRAFCRRQLAVSMVASTGDTLDCTGVQVGPLLDELFSYTGPLGCLLAPDDSAGGVLLALWAPTAQEVTVIFYNGACGEKIEEVVMEARNDGVWRTHGPSDWWGRYYTYRIKAYHPQIGKIAVMEVPDPYSRACSANAGRTLACNLSTWSEVVPGQNIAHWRKQSRPKFEHRGHAVVYELHIRDFSSSDETVPASLRGKYLAFEQEGTQGDLHLRRLASAGITHVQLLPSYDFGSVPERPTEQRQQQIPLGEAPDSEVPQAKAMEVADQDAFNWGYDPVLHDVPEGSYASDPDGGARILEHRRMVAALHAKGLRVVVDVVYNHTLASGPEGPQSVLDKCVPGYYHRRSESGGYENSTCMNNTAAERSMMERLIVDSVVHWAVEYRIDGFRFDLMGHLPLRCMQRCRAALDALTLVDHGVDGPRVLMYGEGWEFGEIAGGQRGIMSVQQNLAGTGIGSFNDRVRDATIGGSPFIDPRTQGFATGLFLRSWPVDAGVDQGDVDRQRHAVLVSGDKIRIALAASLWDFRLAEDCDGNQGVFACDVHGGGVAYAAEPEEIINYVSAHDNETLFDNTAWKMPPSLFSADQRMRANWLCSAIIALSHGIPFFHAGDEVLRSKSLDRDSYNSGDWFNVLDFSGKRSAFGSGLPPQSKNGDKWPLMRPLLRDLTVRPTLAMVEASKAKFCELLRLRASTPLIGLVDAADVQAKVNFPDCGIGKTPGIIMMQVRNGPAAAAPTGSLLCRKFARVVVVFSAHLEEVRIPVPLAPAEEQHPITSERPRWTGASRLRTNKSQPALALACCKVGALPLQLHPLQAASEDIPTRAARLDGGELLVPSQSAVVFVEPLPGCEGWTDP